MQSLIYKGHELEICYSTYQNNGATAVFLRSEDGEFYGSATVNLSNSHTLPSDCAYVDENNMPGISKALVESGIARPTGQSAQSGFCHYNVYQFNLELLTEV